MNLSRHLRTSKHKWSDLSAKNAVSLFQLRKTKSSVKENRKPKKCPLCPAVLKRLDEHLRNKHGKVHDKEYLELLKAAEIHDQKLYKFSMTQSPRKQTTGKDISTKPVSTPCKRSFIPESSKSSYRISDHKPNSALPLQLDDLTTETNSPEQIQLITATNSPEQIHLATSIDSLGGDINIREEASQKISCASVLSKRHCVKSKSQKPSNCSERDEEDPADVTFEPNAIDMMADREIIKSVCISEELKTIYEIFLNYLKGPECCQKNAQETVNEVRRIGIIIKGQSINDLLKANLIRDVYLGICNEKGYKPDSIRKYLRSLNEFYTFLVLRRSEISLHYLSNEEIVLLQKNVTKWSGTYKKPARERFYERQMEDYQVLVDDKQIKIYFESSHAQEAANLFRELKENDRRITQKEFCTLRDNLFVIIELGNAHRSGVCANMLLSEYNKREYKDNFWMIYVRHHKTFYSSGHAVVTMTQENMERLKTFVKIRKQSKPSVPNVFVSWTGSKMASGSISTQLCSLWRKIGILSKSDKNLCCNIIRKSASTGAQEAKDKRAPQLADLMTHSLDTAKKHYYVRRKQLSAASGSSALREVVFKHDFSSSAQLEEAPSVSVSPRKYWKQEEINELKKAFQDDLANNLLSIETVRQRLTKDDSLQSKLNATTRQTYDKLRSLAVSGQVFNSVGVSI